MRGKNKMKFLKGKAMQSTSYFKFWLIWNRKGELLMRITSTNLHRKDGSRIVNGYKIALQKSEVEKIGMHDGTELVPTYKDGEIILIEAERLFVDKFGTNVLERKKRKH